MRKIILLLASLVIIIVALLCDRYFTYGKAIYRYEQHKEALSKEDSGSIYDDSLITHLPIITIDTHNQKIPGSVIGISSTGDDYYEKGDNGEEEIIVDIKIFDNESAQNNINDVATLESKALFAIRGNSSRLFNKKSYKITFVDDENLEKEQEVMGMSAGEEWALYAPFLDKTLLRNYMWLNISGSIMGYAPNVRFCECYIDGEYKGIFVMMETIKRSESRVNISTYDENTRAIPYMLKMDRIEDDNSQLVTFSRYTSHLDYAAGFTILYPGRLNLNDTIKDTISQEISYFEKSLYSYDFNDPQKGYEKYIDVDSWVDYYIIQEFLANNDMCSRSTYLHKDKGGKLAMGPVWDFNNVCDNYLEVEYPTEGFFFADDRIWYEMLMKDEKFVKKVQNRYKELRKTYLNEEYLLNYIDDTIAYLGKAVDRNFEVWGYTFERENQTSIFEYLSPIERNPESYEEAVNQYKEFLIKRGKWLDENIDNLSQYCHYSRNKLFVE